MINAESQYLTVTTSGLLVLRVWPYEKFQDMRKLLGVNLVARYFVRVGGFGSYDEGEASLSATGVQTHCYSRSRIIYFGLLGDQRECSIYNKSTRYL